MEPLKEARGSAVLSCAAVSGWLGLLDASRAALEAPRPFTGADFGRIVLAYAAAGAAWGAVAGLLGRRGRPAAPRIPAPLLLALVLLGAGCAGRFLPRRLATPSLLWNAGLAAAAFLLAGGLLLAGWRRFLRSGAMRAGRRGRLLAAAALLPPAAAGAVAAFPAGPPPGPSPPVVVAAPGARPPNVLVVLVDTLRADRLGDRGPAGSLTPRLDGFAAGAADFRQARTTSSWTLPSITSLLTGLRPERHGVLTLLDALPDGVPTLPSLCGAAGYRTAIFSDSHLPMPEFGLGRGVTGEYVGPDSGGVRASLPWVAWAHVRDWTTDSYRVGTPFRERGAPALVRGALRWIDAAGDRPWCAYLHWMESHVPYAPASPSRPGRPRVAVPEFLGTLPFDRAESVPPGDLRDMVENYDDEVREVDAAFGGLLDGLGSRGLLDRTVVLFTSDHGEEFFEHGGWTHGHSLHEEVVRIPCLLRDPGGLGRGSRIDAAVRIEDMLPTLLDLCGLRTDTPMDGRSALPLLRGEAEAPRPVVGYCRRLTRADVVRSAVLDGRKLVVAVRGGARVEKVFDLRADPGERSPLPAPADAGLDGLRRLLEEADRIQRAAPGAGRSRLPAETRRALEALGYLGAEPGEHR